MTRHAFLLALLVCSGVTGACGGNSPQDPGGNPPAGGGSGGSGGGSGAVSPGRLQWDQAASDAETLAGLSYTLWIGDAPGNLSDVRCGPFSGGSATCSAPIRPLAPGVYQLRLSAVATDGTASEPSAPIQVTVGSRIAVPVVPASTDPEVSRQQSRGLRLESLAEGLTDVSALAVLPDGHVLISQRDGRVLLTPVAPEASSADPAASHSPSVAGLVDDVGTGGLLALASAPDFLSSGHVFLGYNGPDGFRVARFTLRSGRLAGRAVIFESAGAFHRAASMRFGVDGQLYLAVDDADDRERARDRGTLVGKLLRLQPDGTVPPDQEGFSPVYLADLAAPGGLDFGADGTLWLADALPGERGGTLNVSPPASPAGARRRGAVTHRYALTDGETATGVIAWRGPSPHAWSGDLLVSLRESGRILRLDLDAADPRAVAATSIVLESTGEPLHAIASGDDGMVYAALGGRLVRLAPPER